MRSRNRLSPAFLRKAPMGKYCDGAGLWLIVRADGGAQWVLRVTVHGRRREMGLGGYPEIGLAKAREIAERWRAMTKDGRDPIKEREREMRAARREDITLAILTHDAFEARKAELKGDGIAGRWLSPLTLHVLPKLGKVPVTDLDQRDIRDTLAPIWHTKADTARKALTRLSIVLKHAAALGLDVDLQATEKAKALLGKSRHVAKNIPAMAWADVPDFYTSLEEPTLTHLALRLLILTGVRSTPLRTLRLEHIEGDVWTVPAEAMKGRKGSTDAFRVPLSTEAQRVIDLARPHARNGYLFPNTRGGVISDMTLSRMMERRGLDARPHGFRTSLRTWLAEATDAPHEVAEAMLAHATDGRVVRAYRRTDWIEQRAALAERWGDHVTDGARMKSKAELFCDWLNGPNGGGSTKRPWHVLTFVKALSETEGRTFWEIVAGEWSRFDRIPHADFEAQFLRFADTAPGTVATKELRLYRGQDVGAPVGLVFPT